MENTTSPAVAVNPAPADAPVSPIRITLDQLVDLCIEKEASDIHFGEGRRVALRVEGKIVFIQNISPLTKEEADAMVMGMITSEDEHKRLERVREIDFSYTNKRGVSFRVNVYYARGRLNAAMRMISKYLPSIDELGIPPQVKNLLTFREGLILLCGPAGSGKSMTMQAILEYINENFVYHVITIENPIEHLFEDKKSIFSQRELGKDTLTMQNALQSAVREDPNVVMVSEINSLETLESVLNLVETGHLVISSMFTKNAKQTLQRLIGFFPPAQQAQVAHRLSESLHAILAQDLVDRADAPGRIAVYELMLTNSNIRNTIRHASFDQLATMMQSGGNEGMITMENYAAQLADHGIITPETAAVFGEE